VPFEEEEFVMIKIKIYLTWPA